MDNLYCSGREKNLTDCHFDGWGNHDCEHTEIAGVVCKVPKQMAAILPARKLANAVELIKADTRNRLRSQFSVRLAAGRNRHEGRVEVHELFSVQFELVMKKG